MFEQLEKDVEKAVCKYAKAKYGWEYRKQQGQGNRGKADRYFINTGGRIVFVEFKKSGKEPTVLQAREINLLRDKGFIAVAIDNIEDGEWFFDSLEEPYFTVELLNQLPLLVWDIRDQIDGVSK